MAQREASRPAKRRGRVPQDVVDEIVRRIVEAAQPELIIMFGSAARGEMGPNSDVDLLVIKRGDYHPADVQDAIYHHMRGIGVGQDIIVATPEVVKADANNPYRVFYPALREGKAIYQAEGAEWPMQSDEPGREDPLDWVRRARSSLAHAQQQGQDIAYEDLCFDAHQAAEKAIKAVFIAHRVVFPYVHNLGQLLELIERSGEPVPEAVRRAEHLNKFAFETRYPGLGPPVTAEEYREAVGVAEQVVRWAEGLIR